MIIILIINSYLHLKSSERPFFKAIYKVLQITSKWKKLKWAIYFLRTDEIWVTLDIQIVVN